MYNLIVLIFIDSAITIIDTVMTIYRSIGSNMIAFLVFFSCIIHHIICYCMPNSPHYVY